MCIRDRRCKGDCSGNTPLTSVGKASERIEPKSEDRPERFISSGKARPSAILHSGDTMKIEALGIFSDAQDETAIRAAVYQTCLLYTSRCV